MYSLQKRMDRISSAQAAPEEKPPKIEFLEIQHDPKGTTKIKYINGEIMVSYFPKPLGSLPFKGLNLATTDQHVFSSHFHEKLLSFQKELTTFK
jgi:hypothetical protein